MKKEELSQKLKLMEETKQKIEAMNKKQQAQFKQSS